MAQYLPYYWIRHGAVPVELCNQVLREREQLASADAGVGINNETPADSHRKTNIAWAPANHWLEGIMLNNALYANRETGWKMQLDTCEQVQLARYDTGHFYEWHVDTFFLADTPTARKLTAVLLLNDPAEFSGGDFELENCAADGLRLQQGSLVVFPSLSRHRATQVTQGTRHSAALWVHGPTFR
jgi:PKHD-type hydroxylase